MYTAPRRQPFDKEGNQTLYSYIGKIMGTNPIHKTGLSGINYLSITILRVSVNESAVIR